MAMDDFDDGIIWKITTKTPSERDDDAPEIYDHGDRFELDLGSDDFGF